MFIPLLLIGYLLGTDSCSIGLTQLRYPKSLSVIRCTPTAQGDPDPCSGLVNGKQAFCQRDSGGESVCCGTTELLLDLLSPNQSSPVFRRVEPPSLLKRPSPPPFLRVFSNGIDPNFLLSSNSRSSSNRYDYQTDNIDSQRKYFDSVAPPHTNMVPPRPSTVASDAYDRVPRPEFTNDFSKPSTVAPALENGPTVNLVATGRLNQESRPNSYSARSTVVLVQDGNCRFVVNTGLPSQMDELKSDLVSKGLSDTTVFDYLLVTSPSPQFIGNLNLFKSNKIIIGSYEIQGDVVSKPLLTTNMPVDLCSPRSQLVSSPGSSADGTSVLLRNVPGMGTVAITGALFLEDDNLTRIDPIFTSNRERLLATRRRIICEADWLIPAHSGPIPVSQESKRSAGC
ncbi:hypothetical protein QR680_004479 [Steinernema hermaphroditum]|uniref:Metallo-beta-lactamase domain-containing protein n=1 Tax=Steinernema hermaphroditum TaxID=289476 RepID=A0AA39HNU3_9BILA|nr:hypothetical protein QR680_004479 [Steinernema hermaphroditum]